MKTSTALRLAHGAGLGHAELKLGDASAMQRAAEKVLSARGDTFKLPAPRTARHDHPLDRVARLRALALARGEYKVEGKR
jgi:hypothetical protein